MDTRTNGIRRTWLHRIGVALVGVVAIATLGAFAPARGPGRGGGPGMGMGPGPGFGFFGPGVERMLDEVKATPKQREQIRAIVDRLHEKRMALHDQQRDRHQQLLSQFEAGKLDRNQLAAEMDRHSDQMKALGHDFADAVVQVQNILTPEQRTIVAQHIKDRMARGPGGPGWHRGDGPRGPGRGPGPGPGQPPASGQGPQGQAPQQQQ